MNTTELENWIKAAPPQLSSRVLRNMAVVFDYDPPPDIALAQAMAMTASEEAESIGLLRLQQMAALSAGLRQLAGLSAGLRRIAGDERRPEKPVDSRAHFGAWQRWIADGPDWLQQILSSTTHEIIDENKLTPKQWVEALWLSEGHE